MYKYMPETSSTFPLSHSVQSAFPVKNALCPCSYLPGEIKSIIESPTLKYPPREISPAALLHLLTSTILGPYHQPKPKGSWPCSKSPLVRTES